MALQSSGPISLADIEGEFGGSGSISLSEYYGAADGVPASGTISMSDFYGTSAYNGPPNVEMWIVGGGGGGGSVYGTMVPGAGGGGSGGGIWNGTTSLAINAGTVFTITIGSGGAKDNNGTDSSVAHGSTGTSYVGPRGGRGGSADNGSLDQAPQRGGGGPGLVGDPVANMAGAAGVSGTNGIGSGGDGMENNGEAAGGGGGGAPTGNNSFQDARYNTNFGLNQFIAGRGQYGINFSQGIPMTIQLGYGAGGGVSDGVINAGGASGTNCTAASANGTYGGGGGGGAFSYSCTTVSDGAAGGDGVAIIQYSNTYDAPSALTGTYTAYNQDGYRTYIFTSNGTITW